MSWKIFKDNVTKKMEEGNWKDTDEFAKYFTSEYDNCIKRGFDITTKNTVLKGNTQLMISLIKLAQSIAISGKMNVNNQYLKLLGNAVVGYWSGATLRNTVIPALPAPGTISNIKVVQNIVSNPGKWKGVPLFPISDTKVFLDTFVRLATIHLFTIKGTCFTISQFPTPLPPGPGIINWTGYKVG